LSIFWSIPAARKRRRIGPLSKPTRNGKRSRPSRRRKGHWWIIPTDISWTLPAFPRSIDLSGTLESRKEFRVQTPSSFMTSSLPRSGLCLSRKSLSSIPALLRDVASSGRGNFEVRIFNQSEDVAERIENGGDADSFANILNVCSFSCAER
jgi:hypothetical protein